ncbi:MAG: hypothetical protein SPH79_00610 [Schaalia hyovaginalis]|uniref:HD domain-containing protein n=2 Tax=Schaalia hyovaginalis TaxID=29316 RepID=A0A923E3J1_9ACTO|nr:HD domain-containing protein [Schaalia hyovaginalis]MBB6334157.1 uncharacterized protein [Schaalia hyovaginalis]MDY3665895.1 hypothetical protein [Schaalia hyovaginalis]MDY5601031.1 hypothetical protein [Schaalia hyovaginalis]MDY6212979.1 hypothetical protein [Schaalia hyovaginalis]
MTGRALMGTGKTRLALQVRETADELARTGRVAEMGRYIQHGSVSTLEHVLRVADRALACSRKLGIRVSEDELIRGAILHDYYLYDWHDPNIKGHATKHPLRALKNAEEDFLLTDRERNIIAAHMWPLPPTRVPRCREAWLVCFADKWCSLEETLFMRGAARDKP